MFGFGKRRNKQDQLLQQFAKDLQRANIEFARAIAEEGLTGERRTQTLAKIAEAERRLNSKP